MPNRFHRCVAIILLALPIGILRPQSAPPVPDVLGGLGRAQQAQVDTWMRELPLRKKIAQLMVVNFYGYFPEIGSEEERFYRRLVEVDGVGGLIVLNRVSEGSVRRAQPYQMAAFLNRMQRHASIPLLVAGDFERGPSMRLDGMTLFPHAMAFGAADDAGLTRRFGEASACEAKAIGVHWILAPSADVNSEPSNPVIHLRSFGQSAGLVSRHVEAFIRGVQENAACPLLATVKHFPGHGDTSVDSHYGLPEITRSIEKLEREDLPPFKAAIDAGVASVMPGHLSVRALDPSGLPATVSAKAVTGLLREKLRFGGIISTDGLDMQGLTKQFADGEASVRALEAGVDVLMIPPNPQASIDAVEAAVRSGRLSEARIDGSLRLVLAAKAKLNLEENRLVDIEKIGNVIPSAKNTALATEVARKAVTIVRNRRGTLPLKAGNRNCAVVLNRSAFTTDGRSFRRALLERDGSAKIWFLDESWSRSAVAQLDKDLLRCRTATFASFVSIGGFDEGAIPLPPAQAQLVKRVAASAVRTVIVGFTNPYLVASFPKAGAAIVPFSNVPTSEVAAADALYGVFQAQGTSPVSIPGLLSVAQE